MLNIQIFKNFLPVLDVSVHPTSLWWISWIKSHVKEYGSAKWEEKCAKSLREEIEKCGGVEKKEGDDEREGEEKGEEKGREDGERGKEFEREKEGERGKEGEGEGEKREYDAVYHAAECCERGDLDMLVYLYREKKVKHDFFSILLFLFDIFDIF